MRPAPISRATLDSFLTPQERLCRRIFGWPRRLDLHPTDDLRDCGVDSPRGPCAWFAYGTARDVVADLLGGRRVWDQLVQALGLECRIGFRRHEGLCLGTIGQYLWRHLDYPVYLRGSRCYVTGRGVLQRERIAWNTRYESPRRLHAVCGPFRLRLQSGLGKHDPAAEMDVRRLLLTRPRSEKSGLVRIRRVHSGRRKDRTGLTSWHQDLISCAPVSLSRAELTRGGWHWRDRPPVLIYQDGLHTASKYASLDLRLLTPDGTGLAGWSHRLLFEFDYDGTLLEVTTMKEELSQTLALRPFLCANLETAFGQN